MPQLEYCGGLSIQELDGVICVIQIVGLDRYDKGFALSHCLLHSSGA